MKNIIIFILAISLVMYFAGFYTNSILNNDRIEVLENTIEINKPRYFDVDTFDTEGGILIYKKENRI